MKAPGDQFATPHDQGGTLGHRAFNLIEQLYQSAFVIES